MPTSNDNKTIIAFVLDFETGGLDCQTCAATQISIHAVDLTTFEIKDQLNLYIKPYPYQDVTKLKKKVVKTKWEIEDEGRSGEQMMEYTEDALEVSGITKEMLMAQGEDLDVVCDKIIDFMAPYKTLSHTYKSILVGQNVTFDIGFMQQIMTYTGRYEKFCRYIDTHVDFFGNRQPLYYDTLLLAKLALIHNKAVSSYKLETLAALLGIEMDDAHDADADVTATEEVFKIFTKRLRIANAADTTVDTGIVSSMKREKLRDHFKI